MRIAFRNFLSTLRRYKAASLLNVIGLTLAFTAFYVIMVQVWWELGYNRSVADADRICLIETADWYTPGNYSGWINRPMAERFIASAAAVEAGGCLWGGIGENTAWKSNVHAGYDKFAVAAGDVSRGFLDVFPFRFSAGGTERFDRPQSIIVSRSAARRLGVGIGDLLWIGDKEPSPETGHEIVGVFDDFPDNSLLGKWDMLCNLGDTSLDSSSEWSFNYFVKLRPGADREALWEQWQRIYREQAREQTVPEPSEEEKEEGIGMRLSPLPKLYFEQDAQTPCPQGSRTTTYTLLGIAILVIVLAFINFVNFFFALVPVRIRTVNTFKVFGAPTSSLRFGFVFEALGLVVISLLIAWWLAFAVQGSALAGYVPAPLALAKNLPVAGLVAGVAFAMALAASLYPAWYITSFAPAMVVKGSFSGTRSGRQLRTLLLGIQFFISIGLIIATLFIRRQHDFMMDYDMGFDKHNLVVAQISSAAANSYESLRQKLLADPQVADVTGASGRLVAEGRMGWGRDFKGRTVHFQCYPVQWNFLRMMGIRVPEGRDFSENDPRSEKGALIFNEAARREFGMVLGDRINSFGGDTEIVGFCADFNFKPLQYGIAPFAFYVIPTESKSAKWHAPRRIYIRTVPGADLNALTDHIRRCIVQTDPRTEPGEIPLLTFDDELGEQYAGERKLTTIVGLFTLLSVAIALMGVFGIVLFETQHRRREVAVRRVMGASRGEILALFNRRYLWIVGVCFAAAAPVAWYAVERWLSTFAYRAPAAWWIFAVALIVVLAVTTLTVTVRSWSAANENPADSVKSE